MLNLNKKLMNLVVLFFVVTLLGCGLPNTWTTPEKAIKTSVQTLKAAKELRITALKTIGDMYKAGTLTDEDFKKDVIRIGDNLQEAINVTSYALEIYNGAATSENKTLLSDKVFLYQQVYGEFSDLVMPYVLEHLVK